MDRVTAAVTAVAVLGLLAAEARHARRGVWVAKPLASLGFVLTALFRSAASTPYGRALFAALVLSLVGDVLLIPRGRKNVFLAGLVAFLCGHLGFCVAFVVAGVAQRPVLIAAPVLVLLGVAIGVPLLRRVEGKMRGPVAAYMVVLSTMVALAVGAHGAGASLLVPVAAGCFYVSDLSVALDRFVRPSFTHKAWGLPLYYGAQLLFAFTL